MARIPRFGYQGLTSRPGTFGTRGTATPAALWTPAEISSTLWLDASDASTITESGGLVSQWNDKSGNGNHLVQVTGSRKPVTGTRTLNSLNVLDFDGAKKVELNAFHSLMSGGRSLYILAQQDTTSNRFISDEFSSSRGTFYSSGGNFAYYNGNTITTSIAESTDLIIRSLLIDAAGTGTAYHDGTSAVVGTVTATNQIGVTIGGRNSSSSNQLDGVIAAVLYCDEEHTDAIRQKVEGYLAWTWGHVSALDAGHPYKSAAPTV